MRLFGPNANSRDAKSTCIYFGSYYRPNKSDLISLEELNVLLLKMGSILHKNNVILAGLVYCLLIQCHS